MAADRTYYLTTAIDYANSTPHLGTAYEKITADVIARYRRMAGFKVRFLMGNDEHSQNVATRAAKEGVTPLEWCDRMEAAFRERWKALDITFDDFIRTTQPRHHAGVKALIEAVRTKNPDDFYLADYEGLYCVGCEGFKLEKDLVEGLCPIHKTKPTLIKEKNWKFRLSKYQEALQKHFAEHPEFAQPETRRNELLAFMKEGLQDISIARPKKSLPWGIELPFDKDMTVWVWFDALTNYISAIGYGQDEKAFGEWWPAELHVIGKDITRFHCIIWPAMLMAAGVALPKQVFGHGWVSFKGERMSKTIGNVVEPLDAVTHFQSPDPLRLYLVREIPYGGDGDFTWERFEERYNADLANNYGNLVSRLVSMAVKYFPEGRIALPEGDVSRLKAIAEDSVKAYEEAMNRHALHEGAAAAFKLIDAANLFIQEKEPFKLAKDPARAKELGRVMWDAAEAVRIATILLHPILPRATSTALERLGSPHLVEEIRLSQTRWGADGAFHCTAGAPLFPRLEKKK